MACVVAPLLHIHEEPAGAVNVTELPEQNVVEPSAVIGAVGNSFTVTVTDCPVIVVKLVLASVNPVNV